ncbi:MAG: hypothetical protein ABI939_07805 [Anaerolineaceae bacterium]
MSGEPFSQRVQNLHDSWNERRQMKGIASAHDFESQFQLLNTLYGWAMEAVGEVHRVYGETVHLSLSPAPTRDPYGPSFSAFLGDSFTLAFALTERRRMGGSRWFISVSVGSSGTGGGVVAAGPERRNGQWTRARLEDLLLSVLGAYERSLSDADLIPGSNQLRARGA